MHDVWFISIQLDAKHGISSSNKKYHETLWRNNNIYTIIGAQDVLAPKLCGEGTPDWMLNVSPKCTTTSGAVKLEL